MAFIVPQRSSHLTKVCTACTRTACCCVTLSFGDAKCPAIRRTPPIAPAMINTQFDQADNRIHRLRKHCKTAASEIRTTTAEDRPTEPTDTPSNADEYLWYFAYGSNMNSTVLQGRRQVTPLEACAARLPGYSLAFDVRGFPYREPAFASVTAAATCSIEQYWQHHSVAQQPGSTVAGGPGAGAHAQDLTRGQLWSTNAADFAADLDSIATPCATAQQLQEGLAASAQLQGPPLPEAHGVAVRISPSDWTSICATEWATHDGSGSYRITPVIAHLYDGRTVPAYTLVAGASKVPQGTTAVASQRYLTLLVEGAKEHSLDEQYQQYLRSLPVYAPPTGLRFAVGRLLYFALSRILFAPVILLGLFLRGKSALAGALQRDLVPGQQGPSSSAAEGADGGSHEGADASAQELRDAPSPDAQQRSKTDRKQAAATAAMGLLFSVPWVARYLRAASKVSWAMHDMVLKPLFGCGVSTAATPTYST